MDTVVIYCVDDTGDNGPQILHHDCYVTPGKIVTELCAPGAQTRLSAINLRYNTLDDVDIAKVAVHIRALHSLTTVVCVAQSFGQDGAHALCDAVCLLPALRTLDLSNNYVGDGSAPAFKHLLVTTQSLQHLYLTANTLGDTSAREIGAGLDENESLVTLDVANNRITSIGIRALASSVTSSGDRRRRRRRSRLRHLLLADNDIDDVCGAKAVANLVSSSTLHTLRVGYNGLGDDGVGVVARALPLATSLRALSLSSTRMTGGGLAALGLALQSRACSTLCWLDVSNTLSSDTDEGDDGIGVLFDSLRHNSTLTHLRLCNTIVGHAETRLHLLPALRCNTSLVSLHLTGCRLDDAHVFFIAQALRTNTVLRTLGLGQNRFGAAGVRALACALEHNSSVHRLYVHTSHGRPGVDYSLVDRCLAARAVLRSTIVHLMPVCRVLLRSSSSSSSSRKGAVAAAAAAATAAEAVLHNVILLAFIVRRIVWPNTASGGGAILSQLAAERLVKSSNVCRQVQCFSRDALLQWVLHGRTQVAARSTTTTTAS